MSAIPVHQLQDRVSSGLEIDYFDLNDEPEEDEPLGAHRDDHYLFFFLETGSAELLIDFEALTLKDRSLYYVLPGQVHHRIDNERATGWYVAVDTALIGPQYRQVFEGGLSLQRAVVLDDAQYKLCHNTLSLLLQKYKEDESAPFHLPIVHALLKAFVGMVAAHYCVQADTGHKTSRPAIIAKQFKDLLAQQWRTIKSPAAYAGMLSISETYLNEVLKKQTGLPVSYWIIQEVMLEAKRLLYYSSYNVKEIAHQLGYADQAYFLRLFKKSTGMTPLEFRRIYRK